MFKGQVQEEEKAPSNDEKLEFTGNNNPSLIKIDTSMTGDFNMKSQSMMDIEKQKTVLIEYSIEDEISEKPDVISMYNHTIMEEPSNEASE
jgi:hypothetical protein